MVDLVKKVKEEIDNSGLLNGVNKVISAISGGADSVCLFDILFELKDSYGYKLECVHVNHSLRGSESDADAEFVRALCKKYGVFLHYKKVDVLSQAKNNSIEDAARKARYGFFKTLLYDCTVVATAHTQNDNVETFFINLCRGSGLGGLGAIPISRPGFIRPMLNVTRRQVLNYLNEKGIEYCTDSSNMDCRYLRNFIRKKILPQLEARNDIDIYKSVTTAIKNINTCISAFDFEAQKIDDSDINELKGLNDGLMFWIISNKLKKEQDIYLDKVHFAKIKEMILNQGGCKRVQIKQNIFAFARYGKFGFEKVNKKDDSVVKIKEGKNLVFGKTINILTKNQGEFNTGFTSCFVDYGKINSNLYVRHRKNGDKFISSKRNCTNSLKKLLINDKMAVTARDELILICDEQDRIVFVEGYGVDRRFKIDKDTKMAYKIDIKHHLGE